MVSRTVTAAVVFFVLVAGCVGSPGGRDLDGTVDLYVGNHDQPVENFQQLTVTVTAVTFVPADRANGDPNTPANGTPTERFDPSVNRTTVDLTTVQGDSAALVDTVAVPVRDRYRTVSLAVSVERAVLASGNETTVRVSNGSLTANTRFGVEPGSETTLLLDVTAVEEDNGTYVLTAAGEPVERNLTAPAAGGSGTDTETETPAGNESGGSSTDSTPTTGTATPTATAETAETATATAGTATGAASG